MICHAQNTINVPTDQPTIQAGIDAASDGDMVLVDDGTYYENINFKGKAIRVASQFWINGDTNHINNTIISGAQPTNLDSNTMVYFISGEDTSSVLCGFTITEGSGTKYSSGGYLFIEAGGIYCNNSSPLIEHNKIINNKCEYSFNVAQVFGGGISIWNETITIPVILRNNILQVLLI